MSCNHAAWLDKSRPHTVSPHLESTQLHRPDINMASLSADAGTYFAAGTTSLQPRLTSRDKLRLGLFFALPIYAQFCLPASIWSCIWHVYIAGSTSVCIIHFSGGHISLDQVGDVAYGLAISSFPTLCKSSPLVSEIIPDVRGWRGVLLSLTFTTTALSYLLPKGYGSDVRVRCAEAFRVSATAKIIDEQLHPIEFLSTYPRLGVCVSLVSVIIIHLASEEKQYSKYEVVVAWEVVESFVRHISIVYLNYT
jgi:hypothetical protein